MRKKAPEDEIVPNTNRRLQRRRKRTTLFGVRRRQIFLEHLAATCNVTASAEAAGVHVTTTYVCRMRDEGFRADWDAALVQGYARLEAALLERASSGRARCRVRGDKIVEGPDAAGEVDWDKGMQLLNHHRRGLAGFTSAPRNKILRVPIDKVAEKLIRKLKALGVRPEEPSS